MRTRRRRIRHQVKHGKHSRSLGSSSTPEPAAALLGLKAAASLGRQSQTMHDIERSIAGSVDERIVVLSRVLPQDMLKGKVLLRVVERL